jgi:hypothetical protein
MTNQHPITPPEELRDEWESEWHHQRGQDTYEEFMAKQAAQWGADQELEACCEWLSKYRAKLVAADLRYVRRPKPPTLKEQALAALDDAIMRGDCITISDALPTLRRALEALPND